jgi:hypothetical protein
MSSATPKAQLDPRFSGPDATARPWSDATSALERAKLYWISTVRRDGRVHTTPLIAVWLDDAVHFTTGPDEQKAKNLAANPHCTMLTGCNTLREGLDVVVEGEAVRVDDDARLRRIADAYLAKYGEEWRFRVEGGAFHHEGGEAHVFAVAAARVLAFGKGEPYSQTAYRFG